MSLPEPKACTACAHCLPIEDMYLCTLPPECFDLIEPDTDERIELIGRNCDGARRQGEPCGPHGALWEPRTP